MYRTRAITESELPLIPSRGLPAQLRNFLHKELRIRATTRHRDLRIEWSDLNDESFFDFDRDRGTLYLNRLYRSQLLHGLKGSSSDVPVVKCMLVLLLRDAILSQRTGSRVREEIDQINRILMEAVKHERVAILPTCLLRLLTTATLQFHRMKFIIIQITNENEILEADISASDSGLKPSKPCFHLMLGPAPRSDIVLTPHEALRRGEVLRP
jgi:hypothetical protein